MLKSSESSRQIKAMTEISKTPLNNGPQLMQRSSSSYSLIMLGLSPLSLLAGPSRSHHILHQVRPRTLQRSLKPLRSRHFSSTSTPFQQLGKITPKRLEIPLGPDSGIVSDRSLPIVSIWRPIIVRSPTDVSLIPVLYSTWWRRVRYSGSVHEHRYRQLG